MNLRDALFSPRAVAIVGQSDDASKTAGRPLKFLRQLGFQGRVYPVNPRRATVLGERAWPSLAALPEAPDHAYIVTPTEAAVAAVEQCGRIGVKVATVLADGFAEAGHAGLARERHLRDTCARTGIRIVGPSSLGVVDLRTKAMLTANAAFDETDLPVGRIFAASHSGSLIGALLSRGKARGVGFAGLVSVGNEVDLSLGEICAATLDDPGIDGYMLFLETMRHADALRRFALEAAERGKPIIAYKLGRSAAARELAVSHTGALAGEDDVADVFLKACGIARVDTLDGLIEGLPLLSRVAVAERGGRKHVGVVTTTAGGATMVVDPLASRGVTIAPASAATLARLAAAGIEVKPARMVDLTVAGARYDTMKATLDILINRAGIRPGAGGRRLVRARATGRDGAADHRLRRRGQAACGVHRARGAGGAGGAQPRRGAEFPHARSLRRCHRRRARAAPAAGDRPASLSAGLRRRAHPRRARGRRAARPPRHRARAGGRARRRHHAGAGAPFPLSGRGQGSLRRDRAQDRRRRCGPRCRRRRGAGRRDPKDLRRVAERRPGARVARVLVQPMAAGLGEALVGYRVDRDVGPLIMVAAGGVLAEIVRDRSLRLAPVDFATAREMIAEVRGFVPLAGYRGKPAGDLDALARAIVALSQLADDATIAEAEINPLMVRTAGEGVVAVDALVRLAESA